MNKTTISLATLAIIASVAPAQAKWCKYRTYRPRKAIKHRHIRHRPARRIIYVHPEPRYTYYQGPEYIEVVDEYVEYRNPKEEMARNGINLMFDVISHPCR